MDRKGKIQASELAEMIIKTVLFVACLVVLIIVSPWFALIIPAIFLWMLVDVLIGIFAYKAKPRRPKDETRWLKNLPELSALIWVVEHPGKKHPEIDFTSDTLTEEKVLETIAPVVEWVNNRYDCMDFRAGRLLRFAMGFDKIAERVSPSGKVTKILDDTFLSLKFWITEKGDESVCYYSENHQLAFFVLAYLIGRRYPDKVFKNDGRTGKEKAEEARKRMMIWFDLRSKYGFSEFYSHNYLPINFCELGLLLVHGDKTDKELMDKAKIALDLLTLDYAHTLYANTTIGPQGRAYARNNLNCARYENNTDLLIDAIWNDMQGSGGEYYRLGQHSVNYINLLLAKDENGEPIYRVPQTLLEIGRCDKTCIIKTSSGINLDKYAEYGLIGHNDKQIMAQLGMGALSNAEIINNTLDFVNEYSLLRNNFLTSFKFFNISFLRWLGVFPLFSRALNLYSNGMALEKANVYIYRTKDFKLSTLQAYKPGSFGAQQTTMAAVLPEGVTVYTHHPQKDHIFTTSPGFWAGYAIAPHAMQYENISVMIHHIPERKPILAPNKMLPYTHTFFSEELLDSCVVEGKYAFCKKGETYLALIGASDFEYMPFDVRKTEIMEGLLQDTTKRFELVQRGLKQFTIYELSCAERDGSFEKFMDRIKSCPVAFDGDKVTYTSCKRELCLQYLGDFTVNGEVQPYDYDRFDSDFIKAKYLDEDFNIKIGDNNLHINLAKNIRTENGKNLL